MRCAVSDNAGGLVPMIAAGRLVVALKQTANHKTDLTRFTEETTPENVRANKLKAGTRVAVNGQFRIGIASRERLWPAGFFVAE